MKGRSPWTALISAVVLVLGPPGAVANSLRCGHHLLDVGDSMYEVLKKCGEPSLRVGSQWYYQPQGSGFTKVVTFANGRVLDIDDGERF
jgi:hypothetical protein